MFSSNQQLFISGTLDVTDIREALYYSIVKAARSNDYCYQISEDGKKFCIGWKYDDKPPEGWNDFSFDFDCDIVARIIKQFLEKTNIDVSEFYGDGSCEKGYLIKVIDVDTDIKNKFYGIVSFEPFINFYAK